MPCIPIADSGPITDLRSFLDIVLKMRQDPEDEWIFRGQREFDWELLPKIDRTEFKNYRLAVRVPPWQRKHHEQQLLTNFQNAARPYVPFDPKNDTEWMAIAQHHGLATSLLDWTANPMTALFFAVEDQDSKGDSVVWCYHHVGSPWIAEENPDPFLIKFPEVASFSPPHVTPRIAVQAGCFTFHPEPPDADDENWRGERVRIKIPRNSRAGLRSTLMKLGVTRATLFPDLDGLAVTTNYRLSTLARMHRQTS